MTMRNKLLVTIACLSVILCTLVTGTIAWLTDKTGAVTNTFTPSDVGVTLVEEAFNGKMIPGTKIDKKATVTVTNDIDCYVFVQVAESANLKDFIQYAMADGWEVLDASHPGVYYRVVAAGAADKAFSVIGSDAVTVKNTVTKAMMNALTADSYPKLTFTAYACQQEGFTTAAAAWTEASK